MAIGKCYGQSGCSSVVNCMAMNLQRLSKFRISGHAVNINRV